MSRFFIDRPIVAMVISIIFVILGLVALVGLPVMLSSRRSSPRRSSSRLPMSVRTQKRWSRPSPSPWSNKSAASIDGTTSIHKRQ